MNPKHDKIRAKGTTPGQEGNEAISLNAKHTCDTFNETARTSTSGIVLKTMDNFVDKDPKYFIVSPGCAGLDVSGREVYFFVIVVQF